MQVINGALTLGQLVQFNFYVALLVSPLRMLGMTIAWGRPLGALLGRHRPRCWRSMPTSWIQQRTQLKACGQHVVEIGSVRSARRVDFGYDPDRADCGGSTSGSRPSPWRSSGPLGSGKALEGSPADCSCVSTTSDTAASRSTAVRPTSTSLHNRCSTMGACRDIIPSSPTAWRRKRLISGNTEPTGQDLSMPPSFGRTAAHGTAPTSDTVLGEPSL